MIDNLKKIESLKFIYRSLKSVFNSNYVRGYCPICENKTIFYSSDKWLRDHYYCLSCFSIPRERALINALNRFYPNWKDLKIHESSPGNKSSEKISKECLEYSSSQYLPKVTFGKTINNVRSENLEALTFSNNSFDLIVTQDVFEHIMDPANAFKEIHRVLKNGGAHIFSMPWCSNLKTSVKRAELKKGEVQFLEKAEYHGNPVDEKGSLVTYDWGLDFSDFILKSSGLKTITYLQEIPNLGIEAQFLEIFVSIKND